MLGEWAEFMLSSPRYIEYNYFFDLLFSFSGILGIAFVFFLDKSHFLLSVLLIIGRVPGTS